MINTLLSIIVTITLGLSGFALYEIYTLNAEIAVLQADVNDKERVNNSITKFWKLHSWAKDQINELTIKQGGDLKSWPDLGVR